MAKRAKEIAESNARRIPIAIEPESESESESESEAEAEAEPEESLDEFRARVMGLPTLQDKIEEMILKKLKAVLQEQN